MKNIHILFSIYFLFLVKCDEEYLSINAKYYPESNEIIYNGNKYILLPKTISQEKEILQKIPPKRFLQEIPRSRPFSGAFWFNLIAFVTLACFAGTMSGLTVGYLSIDSLILEIKMGNGTESERYYAEKIYKLVANHHWLLVTLLLCNSFACEAMPIFLSKLVNEMMAVILSVTVLLFVGEIIPQALCTGPNQMKIASILAPFTYFLMIITYPISYPIALFMDYVIGVQGKSRFCNTDLKSIIELHVKEILKQLSRDVTEEQVGYFTGFLDIVNKKVGDLIFLPIEKTLKLDYNTKITKITLKRLIDSGYSRIPVYLNQSDNLIGILRMKELVGKDISKGLLLSELGINLSHPIHVYEDTLILDLFERFKGGKSHMAFIHQNESNTTYYTRGGIPYNNIKKRFRPTSPIKGIITLEDLIESWLKISISDEEDYMHDQDRTKRGTERKKTFLSFLSTKDFNFKLNQLYDSNTSKSPIVHHKKDNQDIRNSVSTNIQQNNYINNISINNEEDNSSFNNNGGVSNNYHLHEDKNDDESKNLLSK